MVAFRCSENSTPCFLASSICFSRNAVSSRMLIVVASMISPARTGVFSLSTVTVPSSATSSIRTLPGLCNRHRHFIRAEVAAIHVRDMRLRVRRPGAHRMRVLSRVLLHGFWSAPVRVAFAQHRIHGAAFDLVVARADGLLFFIGGLVGIVGQCVALGLEFRDGGLQLRNRSADVRQLDDVGFRLCRELAQFGQRIGNPLRQASAFPGNWK